MQPYSVSSRSLGSVLSRAFGPLYCRPEGQPHYQQEQAENYRSHQAARISVKPWVGCMSVDFFGHVILLEAIDGWGTRRQMGDPNSVLEDTV